MMGYYGSIYKMFWYIYTMFCSMLYFNYLGMMLIAITPSFPVAAVLQSAFYTLFNLLAGFMIPLPVHNCCYSLFHLPNKKKMILEIFL